MRVSAPPPEMRASPARTAPPSGAASTGGDARPSAASAATSGFSRSAFPGVARAEVSAEWSFDVALVRVMREFLELIADGQAGVGARLPVHFLSDDFGERLCDFDHARHMTSCVQPQADTRRSCR